MAKAKQSDVKSAKIPNKSGAKEGRGHPTVKKVGAMNNNNTTPQMSRFSDPAQAQMARGNGPVAIPGGPTAGTLGRSADVGVKGANDSSSSDWGGSSMPANIPNIPGF